MTDKTDEAVARPPGHCDDDKAWAEFTRQYAGQPRRLPGTTDFALANAIFMADRNDMSLLHYQTAAKERIRWLSIRLAEALRRVEVMEKALGLLNGDHEIKPMPEARLDRLLDHEEHFRAVGGPNDSATFQWSDQVALLHEAVLAFRARQALTGEAS
jgi:hypothetical protein